MKLDNLFEAGNPWNYFENPGVKHGDACPKCGSPLKNKHHAGMGPPSHVGCKNNHAFKIKRAAKRSLRDLLNDIPSSPDHEGEEAEVEKFDAAAHSCPLKYRKEGDETWARRNASKCEACREEYESDFDDDLDAGFVGGTPEVAPGDHSIRPATDDRRRVKKPGQNEPIKADDSKVVRIIKTHRDMGGDEWNRKGDERYGKRIRNKAICSFAHSCHDPSAPMPDPMATRKTGPNRHNTWFVYNHMDTRVWPVSGMMGFSPKPYYERYILSKLECPVCSGELEGCDNSVSTTFGKPKPFCSEHVEMNPYPAELGKMLGSGGEPDPNKEHQRAKRHFRDVRGGVTEGEPNIRVGDEVKFEFRKPGKDGSGELVGVVIEVDKDFPTKSHRVKWVNPRTASLVKTWEDPATLEIIGKYT